jgi:hypothetical protein
MAASWCCLSRLVSMQHQVSGRLLLIGKIMNTKNDTFVSTRSSPTQMEPGPTALSPIATSETLVPGGWETHTSQQCEYEISYPAEIQIHPQTPYSDLLVFDLSNSDAGPRNFVYVSVITPDIISIVSRVSTIMKSITMIRQLYRDTAANASWRKPGSARIRIFLSMMRKS